MPQLYTGIAGTTIYVSDADVDYTTKLIESHYKMNEILQTILTKFDQPIINLIYGHYDNIKKQELLSRGYVDNFADLKLKPLPDAYKGTYDFISQNLIGLEGRAHIHDDIKNKMSYEAFMQDSYARNKQKALLKQLINVDRDSKRYKEIMAKIMAL